MQITSSPALSGNIIIPLAKIDVERRLVIGVAAQEEPDKTNEIMDYDTAKPEFQRWSNSFAAATGGLSKGNLRVMHTKSVAGRFEQVHFDDENKRIEVCAKVVDDAEWKKVLDGCYTGFSIGGGYARKWPDALHKGCTRYTPKVAEISLVDSPCMHSARFAELVKGEGLVEQLELRGRPEGLTFGEMMKAEDKTVKTFGVMWAKRPLTFGELLSRSRQA